MLKNGSRERRERSERSDRCGACPFATMYFAFSVCRSKSFGYRRAFCFAALSPVTPLRCVPGCHFLPKIKIRKSSAPEGQCVLAQGNALGDVIFHTFFAPEGQWRFPIALTGRDFPGACDPGRRFALPRANTHCPCGAKNALSLDLLTFLRRETNSRKNPRLRDFVR